RFGNTVVVYEGAPSRFNHNILARKVFSNGVLGATMTVDNSIDYEWNPSAAMDLNDGDFVVSYDRRRNTGTGLAGPNRGIVREMNADGTSKRTTNLGAAGSATALSINASDVFFLAYQSFNKSGDPGAGIFGRRGFLA